MPGYLHLREMVNYLLKSGADLSECKFYISNAKLIFNHIDPPTDEPIPGDFNERLESCHVLNLNQLQALPNNPFQFLELECVRLCDVLVSISWDEYFEHPSETDVASINQLVSSINKLIANSNQNIGYTVDTLQRLIMLTRGKISTNHGIEVTPMQQKLESFLKNC
ncbi:MAG: hypothetical protein HWD59_13480 [Coxiellaceae bacterium]|nr:MAG: hypothetical protein HWD59_13480 [Coxiellaceae bacterium]